MVVCEVALRAVRGRSRSESGARCEVVRECGVHGRVVESRRSVKPPRQNAPPIHPADAGPPQHHHRPAGVAEADRPPLGRIPPPKTETTPPLSPGPIRTIAATSSPARKRKKPAARCRRPRHSTASIHPPGSFRSDGAVPPPSPPPRRAEAPRVPTSPPRFPALSRRHPLANAIFRPAIATPRPRPRPLSCNVQRTPNLSENRGSLVQGGSEDFQTADTSCCMDPNALDPSDTACSVDPNALEPFDTSCCVDPKIFETTRHCVQRGSDALDPLDTSCWVDPNALGPCDTVVQAS